MIAKNEYMVVITAATANEFAKDIVEAGKAGYVPIAGQWAFFQGGQHVAYYVDTALMGGHFKASATGDHAEPAKAAPVLEAKPTDSAVADWGMPGDWDGIPEPPGDLVDAHAAPRRDGDVDRSYT